MCEYEKMSLELIDNKFVHLKRCMEMLNAKLLNKKVVLFGCGASGNVIYNYLKDRNIKVSYFTDNDRTLWGEKWTEENIECISPEEAFLLDDSIIFITTKYVNDIIRQIEESRANCEYVYPPINMEAFISIIKSSLLDYDSDWVKKCIKQLFSVLDDDLSKEIVYFKVWGWFASSDEISSYSWEKIYQGNQYIPKDIISLSDDATIIDCGAYIGDTLQFFLQKKMKFNKYIAFEMDQSNFNKMQEYVSTLEPEISNKIETYNVGVGDKERNILYYSKKFSSFVLHDTEDNDMKGETDGINVTKCVTLDKYLKGKKISYLKMDIEGEEMAALEGSVATISESHPDCAICIYHLATDLWEIPLFLHKLNSMYKIKIRQHCKGYYDTVCYAVDRNEGKR